MKLSHPKSKQTIEVDPAHIEQYTSQGWVPVEDKKPKAPPKPPAAPAAPAAPDA